MIYFCHMRAEICKTQNRKVNLKTIWGNSASFRLLVMAKILTYLYILTAIRQHNLKHS